MHLTRVVPKRTEKHEAKWLKAEWMPMSQKFRDIRSKSKRNPMDKCWWCKHPFADGEMMALTSFIGQGGNKTLCQSCAMKLMLSETEEGK